MAIEKWRPYLHCQQFVIKTDHQSLSHLENQKVVSKVQQKAPLKLMDLQYKIEYKKGPTNAATDALSRVFEPSVLAISVNTPSWLERLQSGYEEDMDTKQLLYELSLHTDHSKGFTLENGIIKKKGRIWVGNNLLA